MFRVQKISTTRKHFFRSTPARLLVVIGIAATSYFGSVATASAASGNCGSDAFTGDRVCYEAWLSDAESAIMHVDTGANGHDYVNIYGWADTGSQLYYDISFDGGSTWYGRQHVHTSGWSGMAYIGLDTEGIFDGPGTWIRACIYNPSMGRVACTPWN
jgi:hypothetical protein